MTSLLFALNQLIEWPPKSLDLRERIVTELRQQRDLNQSAVRAMRTRVEACVEKTGGHDEGHWG